MIRAMECEWRKTLERWIESELSRVFYGDSAPAKTPRGIDGDGMAKFRNRTFANDGDRWMLTADIEIAILRIEQQMY